MSAFVEGYELISYEVDTDYDEWSEEIGEVILKTPAGTTEVFSIWLDDFKEKSAYVCLPTRDDEEDPLEVYPLDSFDISIN